MPPPRWEGRSVPPPPHPIPPSLAASSRTTLPSRGEREDTRNSRRRPQQTEGTLPQALPLLHALRDPVRRHNVHILDLLSRVQCDDPQSQSLHPRMGDILCNKVRRSGAIKVGIEMTSVIADQLLERMIRDLGVSVDVNRNASEDGRFESN